MRRLALILALMAAIVAAPAPAPAFSLLGLRNQLVQFLLSKISVEGVFEITAEKAVDREEGGTTLVGVEIADSQGVWFRAGEVSFDWDKSAILGGRLVIDDLILADVEMLRQPVVPPGEEVEVNTEGTEAPPQQPVWPRAPITTQIKNMVLKNVHLHEPVLGQEISFDATGSAQDIGDIQSAHLDLHRTDDISGSIDLAYTRNFADNTLKLDLDAHEDAGGLVSYLLALPEDVPTTVSLHANGTPGDWRVAFDLDMTDYLQAKGNAVVDYSGPVKIDAELTASPGPKMPQNVAQVLGNQAELVVKAEETGDQTIRITTARITSPDLHGTASGTYERDTGAVDMQVDLTAEPGLAAVFPGVAFAGMTFKGDIKGQPGSLAANGELKLDGFETASAGVQQATLTIDVGQSGPADNPTTKLTANGHVDGLRLDKIGPDIIGEAELQLVAGLTGDEVNLETAWIDSKALKLSASGTANISTGDFDVLYGVSAPQVGPVLAPYAIQAQGSIDATGEIESQSGTLTVGTSADLTDLRYSQIEAGKLHLEGTVVQTEARTTFHLTGTGAGMRIGQIGPEVLGHADLAASGAIEGNLVTLDSARLSSPVLDATAEGRLDLTDQSGRFDYTLSTDSIGPVAAALGIEAQGAISSKGVVTLPPASANGAPEIEGTAKAQNLVYQGQKIGDLTASYDVTLSATPEGTIDLALSAGPYAPARIRGGFRLDGQKLTLTDLRASALGVGVSGPLTVDLDAMTAEGALAIKSADLAALGDLLGTPVKGSASGTVKLTTPKGQQNAALALSVSSLTAYGYALADARVEARIADLLGTPYVNATLRAGWIAGPSVTLTNAVLSAKGPLSAVEIALRASGALEEKPLTLAAAARADLAGAAMRATVSRFEATIGDDRIALIEPLTLVARGSAIELRDMTVALPDNGRLTGHVSYYGGPMAGTVLLDMPDVSVLARLFGMPIETGALKVDATFDTRPGHAKAHATVNGHDIVFSDITGTGRLAIAATADWNGRIATVDATLTGSFGAPLVLHATAPVRAGGALPELASHGPVSASLRWEGQIGDLWALVPAPGQIVTGHANIDIGVSGDISDPKFTGGLAITDGTYQNLDAGTILTDLRVETNIRPDGALGISLTAADGATGTVRVAGQVGFGTQGVDLTATASNAVLVRRDDAIARIGANLHIFGPLDQLAIEGKVIIGEAEIRLVVATPPSIITLGDIRIKGEPPPKESSGPSLPIRLNIDVSAPGRIFVRGRGLDSEWKADLHVGGDISQPTITGRVEAVRGRLDLIGKTFRLETGEVLFNGGRVIDPRLHVVLVHESNDLTGRMIVSGTASDPKLSFSSTPSLPEDEVLPQILFGQSRQSLSPGQAVQLALGLATLMNGGGGTLDEVRSMIGLDTLNIEQSEEGDTSLAVGKHVTDRVWVGTKQSLGEGGTSVAVEVDVFKNFDVQGDVSTTGDSSIGFQWKKDF